MAAEQPQHMAALAHANEIRLARARLKERVLAGEVTTSEIVRDPPPEAETMTVAALLSAQRRWGLTRSRKFLARIAVNENRQLGRLTARQRELLAEELEFLAAR